MTGQSESLTTYVEASPTVPRAAAGSVLFVIRSLHIGGAERQVATLATGLFRRGWRVHVATFYPGGELMRPLVASGVQVTSLGKRGRWDLISFSYRLTRLVRRERPDVLYPFLPDPNLLTAVLRPFLPKVRLVWGVGASYMDLSQYDWAARMSDRVAGLLSRRADVIIANSRAGETYHRARGYPAARLRVVPNGIDSEYFRATKAGREGVRAEWNVPAEAPLIGLVARLDPMKDHGTFLEAAALLAARRPDVRFVCVGGGAAAYARTLRDRASALGLDNRLRWAGPRVDMPAVYSALDLATLTSIGEGLPNVVAEAMSCGVPCVVTDAGDSAWVVGELGQVVTPADPAALAEAWERVLTHPAGPRSAAQRERIVREFSVERLVTETERLLWAAA